MAHNKPARKCQRTAPSLLQYLLSVVTAPLVSLHWWAKCPDKTAQTDKRRHGQRILECPAQVWLTRLALHANKQLEAWLSAIFRTEGAEGLHLEAMN